ncbi:MAG: aldo/keto reductase, partial [Bifidobacterium tsurumiense]|uniref:aldo/keto reductase n=1 Tax=Bifidobacterium tsurumiense TaxID=356829 RepID=UPI002A828C21
RVNAMKYVTLSNGENIPTLGLGTYRLSSEEARQSVARALQHGYRLIDTANFYMNEKAVGQGIAESGVPREEIFLTSKIWPSNYRKDKAAKAIDSTLHRLNVDYLDLLLLHQPVGKYTEAWVALEDAVRAGKVKSIGLSNFIDKDLDRILDQATIKPALVQAESHPYWQRHESRARLSKLGIAMEAWYPLGSANSKVLNEPIFKELAERYHKSVVQVILRWHIQAGNIVIPGSKNPAHIDSNFNIFDFELTEEDMAAIAQLDQNKSFLNVPKWVLGLTALVNVNYGRHQ